MTGAIRFALFLVLAGTVLAVWSLANTTALSMTLFFTFGIPAFGIAALLYVMEVLRDLRRHRVL
jgi:hypothetical protein